MRKALIRKTMLGRLTIMAGLLACCTHVSWSQARLSVHWEELTAADFRSAIQQSQGTCLLPFGILEKHGPHLPLGTDLLDVRYAALHAAAEEYAVVFPEYYFGQIFEARHEPGTVAYSRELQLQLLQETTDEMARNGCKKIIIVNGHGGNRGMLEALGRELHGDFGLNLCALHLGAMMSPVTDATVPEIHAGKDETSVMLALAPELVRRERIPGLKAPPVGDAVRATILDPATSWPWSSGDERIAVAGVIGDARAASVEHGNAIVARIVEATGAVLKKLGENLI